MKKTPVSLLVLAQQLVASAYAADPGDPSQPGTCAVIKVSGRADNDEQVCLVISSVRLFVASHQRL